MLPRRSQRRLARKEPRLNALRSLVATAVLTSEHWLSPLAAAAANPPTAIVCHALRKGLDVVKYPLT
jgi:hypothetical protein